jgi:hypothetical protein
MNELLIKYCVAKNELTEWKDKTFPIGSKVYVNAPRYIGDGIVAKDSMCPMTQLPVKLENGNIWWYSLETCEPL